MNLADDLNGVGRGALLVTNLDEFAVVLLGRDENLAPRGGCGSGRLFDVDVLARFMEALDGHGGVPVVGHSDGDDIDIFGGENVPVVAVGCGGVAEGGLRRGGKFREDGGVHIAYVGDAGGLCVRLQS